MKISVALCGGYQNVIDHKLGGHLMLNLVTGTYLDIGPLWAHSNDYNNVHMASRMKRKSVMNSRRPKRKITHFIPPHGMVLTSEALAAQVRSCRYCVLL